MKRLPKTVAVEMRGGAFVILLDDTPAATPRNNPFLLPTLALAEAIAEEWREHEKIAPLGPLTRLANSAIDRPRAEIVSELMKYVDTDLLFYRAEEEPLALRQAEGWDPLLAWAREHHGAEFEIAAGIAPFAQAEATRKALRAAVEAHDPFAHIALHAATEILGSLILSLALAAGRLSAAEAFALSRIDERFQSERWGIDELAEKRGLAMARELETIARFLALARP